MKSMTRRVQNKLLAFLSVIGDDMQRTLESNQKLFANLMRMFSPNFGGRNIVSEEDSLDIKRKNLVPLDNPQVST